MLLHVSFGYSSEQVIVQSYDTCTFVFGYAYSCGCIAQGLHHEAAGCKEGRPGVHLPILPHSGKPDEVWPSTFCKNICRSSLC